MPESIFGSPSHLLTAESAPDSAQTGKGVRMPAPVHQPPPSFTDIQFGTIGKPPNLLSRISAPDPAQTSFRSPSPAMLHPPPPVATHAPVTNSRKLVERIQMGPSQLNSSAKSQSLHPTRELPSAPRINRSRYVPANPHLIPPIEVLPTASESNMLNIPSLVTPTTEQSNRDISSSSNPSGSPKPHSFTELIPQAHSDSSQVLDVAQPETSQQQVAQDSLSALYAKLLENNNALLPAFQMKRMRRSLAPLFFDIPYSQTKMLPADDDNVLVLTTPQTPNMPASRSTHIESLIETMKKLQSITDERVFAFEEHMLAREAECQAQMQAVQNQLEELRAREERLVALEEESRLREETRRARDAQRRAQDDQQRFEDESRRAAIQEEIAEAMKLLEEAKSEKTQWQAEKERAEREMTLAQNNAPPLQLSADVEPRVEKEDGMTEEEMKAVDGYNKSLVYRHKLTEKLKKQIAWTRQSSDTLQHMKETRLQAVEVERRRVAEEAEKQRVQAEEAAKQADEEQQMQRGELLVQQSAHTNAQPQKTQVDTQAEYNRRRAQVLANKQQTTSENAARIRAERAGHLVVSTTDGDGPEDMNVELEVDELASPLEHDSMKPASQTKKTSHSQGTSGNDMLGASSTTTSSSMSTPATSSTAPASYKTPSFVQVITDAPLYPTQMASELHLSDSPPLFGPLPTSKKIALPSTPNDSNDKQANLSPAQRDANLRHIKKNRHRIEESAAGDRSVKRPDDSLPIKTIKTEEVMVENSLPASTLSTDAVVRIPNDNPPSAQAISNTNTSQTNDIPQTSAELVIGQAPSASLRADARVGSAGASGSVTGLTPIRNSPDPWEWTADAISPHSDPSESAYRYDPNQRSRQTSQNSGRTRSPEPGFTRNNANGESRKQRQRGVPRYADHYSPPTSATSSHHQHLEQSDAGAYGLPIPPRPMSPMNSGRKRPAEHDNEDDNHDRRRPRGDHYVPERTYQNRRVHLVHYSPHTATERRRGRSTSPELRSSIHDRLRSPSPSRQIRPHIERDALDRRGRNEGSYRPDYTNNADLRRTSDVGYSMEGRSARHEERDPRDDEPSLLGRLSTPGERGNANRGRGRGRGDAGRGRGGVGGRGRSQQVLPPRPLEDRIAK
ncbi:hypothetical protein EDB19DRAFT_1669927 [Suillus lakei]|nr:hypothetical protein EDB19DRAFT_1669927 [Suillus lakei]